MRNNQAFLKHNLCPVPETKGSAISASTDDTIRLVKQFKYFQWKTWAWNPWGASPHCTVVYLFLKMFALMQNQSFNNNFCRRIVIYASYVENIKQKTNSSRQGQARNSDLELWSRYDSRLPTGPVTITQTHLKCPSLFVMFYLTWWTTLCSLLHCLLWLGTPSWHSGLLCSHWTWWTTPCPSSQCPPELLFDGQVHRWETFLPIEFFCGTPP